MTSPAKRIASLLPGGADANVGLLAQFPNPGALYDAVKAIRKRGYTRIEAYSPFPIHGMDAAMGLSYSKLGFLVFFGAITGTSLAFLMQWWMNAYDYPINISNKPLFAIEPSVPVAFELTILFSALTAVGGMLALNGLPRPYNPLFFSKRFARVTDDGFFLQVETRDGNYDEAATAELLYEIGAMNVEFVGHDGTRDITRGGLAAPIEVPEPVIST
ncbi:MAG: DUF3341 domain-containing protein [Bacteroidota bacterium]